MADSPLFNGVVEGFYGRPWNARQRHQLFGWMKAWGLNTYFYAPKGDPKHRASWTQPYDDMQLAELGALIGDAARHGLRFVFGIAPGLSICHASDADFNRLLDKVGQILSLGCRHLAILFDDIAPALDAVDARRFSGPAEAQAFVANRLLSTLGDRLDPGSGLLFCPTVYCGRMAGNRLSDSTYLAELGRALDPAIPLLWTGPEIISEVISPDHIQELQQVLGSTRPIILWDNLHANDYDLRRLHLGPFAGRPPALKACIRGVLLNPNCEFEANFIPVHTLAAWCRDGAPPAWDPIAAFRAAVMDWLPSFQGGTPPVQPDDLTWIAEVFHLPFNLGPSVARWLVDARNRLLAPSDNPGAPAGVLDDGAAIAQRFSDALDAMPNRDLCFALQRHVWALKESTLLLRDGSQACARLDPASRWFEPMALAPRQQEGGFLDRTGRLAPQAADGRFDFRPPSFRVTPPGQPPQG